MKIAVAMSGGVDSSVAAALSVEKYGAGNVFGVTMKLFCYDTSLQTQASSLETDKSCCSLDAINDAAAVCKQLGIKHYIVNLEKEFEKDVIDDFVLGYQSGLTPNPCVRCNQLVKYQHLLRKVEELGADKLVTGHYARITSSNATPTPLSSLVTNPGISSGPSEGDPRVRKDDSVVYHLLRGLDPKKDQSYFLYNLTQEQLAKVEFPIGELTKPETRKLARKYGLKTAEKTESQDICFITTNVQDFLLDKVEQKPGDIVAIPSCHSREGGNPDFKVGKIFGQHNGLANYTIGQRKGLGGGFSAIMYVIGLDKDKNEVIIGPEEALYGDSLVVLNPHWVGIGPKLPFKCMAKIRYASDAADCTLSSVIPGRKSGISIGPSEGDPRIRKDDNSGIVITFEVPQKAITPGQSVVFYDVDEVIGGGVIAADRT